MAENSGGHPVAHPVDVDELAGFRQAIDGADVHISGGSFGQGVLVPVPQGVVVGGQPGVQLHLLHRHGAAEAYAYPVDLAVQVVGGFLLGGEDPGREAPLFQIFGQVSPVCHCKHSF